MADSTSVIRLKERFAQQARAALPFNPLDSTEIVGANVDRLKLGMEAFAWTDHRFVTQEQAAANGWAIRDGSGRVHITLRDASNGAISERALFNAENVLGMPSLEAMLAMPEAEFLKMRGEAPREAARPTQVARSVPTEALEYEEELDDDIEIGPALHAELQTPGAQRDAGTAEDLFFASPLSVAGSPEQLAGQAASAQPREAGTTAERDSFAVMAPYWLDGLHNFDGVELAKQVNMLIDGQNLARDKTAITTLLQSYPNARRLGLEIVSREKFLSDPHLKANLGEPLELLGGELVRDREGGYRPKAGGLAVLKDKGTSVSFKSRSELAHRGAMELALKKGWKSIELKGTPKTMAKAWLEAKVMGLEVVNYTPTEQDRQKLAERMAQEIKKRDAAARVEEQAPETIEVVPAVDQQGRPSVATVAHTTVVRSVEPEQAPILGESAPAQERTAEVVTRTVVRMGDVVRDDVATTLDSVVASGPEASAEIAREVSDPIVAREASVAINEAERQRASIAALEGTAVEDLPVRLVAHGSAPYRRNEANSMSYFADVEIASGVVKTFWGKDLERSIAEAGAVPGDSVVLQETGRAPVVGADGKTTHPVKWLTTLHSRGVEAAKAAAAEKVPVVELATSGLHIGPIVKVEGGRVAQKAGRDPTKLVWHDVSKFNGAVPGVGEQAEISYGKGGVQVKTPAREQELSR